MSKTLYGKLIEYSESGIYPFCMPGHKRNFKGPKIDNPYMIDITEVDGFDNLHEPQGLIRDIEDKASYIYKCRHVMLSVNGSTAGMLAAVTAVPGDVIVARNCHKSVFDAVSLNKKKVYYTYPAHVLDDDCIYGGVNADEIDKILTNHPEIKSVVITSPTYEGFVSDIKRIAGVVHSHDAVLIVDEAHGAHFTFCKDFPVSAMYLGADIVVESLHKTLPSLNQTALVFVNNDELEVPVRRALSAFTTTSPSYTLLASIEYCMLWCHTHRRDFSAYIKLLDKYKEKLSGFRNIHLLKKEEVCSRADIYDVDPSKLVFICNNMSGVAFADFLLNERKIQMEMAGPRHVVGITSIMDTKEGFSRLLKSVGVAECMTEYKISPALSSEELEKISLLHAFEVGRVYHDFIYVYPPGCPAIAPGEEFTVSLRDKLVGYIKQGMKVMLWERFTF